MREMSPPRPLVAMRALLLLAAATLTSAPYAKAEDAAAPDAVHAQMSADQSKTALRLARAARAAGDLNSAVSLFRALAAESPNDTSMALEYGDTLNDAGFMDEAIGVYSKIGNQTKDGVSALLGLERAYLRLGQSNKALTYADQAIALAPQDEHALIGRGVALDILNRHSEAQSCYRNVLVASPRNVSARNDLALSLALTGKYAEAIEIITPMARSADATPRMRQNLALIYGLQGNRDAAGSLSRVDMSAAQTDSNLRFFEMVRQPVK